jgi:hypothetical protein
MKRARTAGLRAGLSEVLLLSALLASIVPGRALAQAATPPAQPETGAGIATPAGAAGQGAAQDKTKTKTKKDAAPGAAKGAPPPGDAVSTPEKLRVYEQIDVTGRASDLVGTAGSATEGVTGHEDIEKRPVLRPGEVLETIPGVVIT